MVSADESVDEHWPEIKARPAQETVVVNVQVNYSEAEVRKQNSRVNRISLLIPAEVPFDREPLVEVARKRHFPSVSALPRRGS